MTKKPRKRIDIVSLKLVRESSILYPLRQVSSPKDAADLLQQFVGDCDREKFTVLCLDTKNQPISLSVISVGSLNSTLVHPREVFKTALLCNSASIILAHNHPSGVPEASREDVDVTKRLCEAGKILGIEVLDHIILGAEKRFCSIKEAGKM
ncbi:MAG TPA: JAB domain-containing protein [Oscillospiraceae bacterium]|nr:JAB domain-containing protein [Oscillospiraceae bacterium]